MFILASSWMIKIVHRSKRDNGGRKRRRITGNKIKKVIYMTTRQGKKLSTNYCSLCDFNVFNIYVTVVMFISFSF